MNVDPYITDSRTIIFSEWRVTSSGRIKLLTDRRWSFTSGKGFEARTYRLCQDKGWQKKETS